MSEAFKCDMCREYCDGKSYTVTISTYADREIYDLCFNCLLKIREIGLKRKLKIYPN